MTLKLPKFVLALTLAGAVALPVLAQTTTLPPLAAVKDGQLIVHSAGSDVAVPLEGYDNVGDLVWSPDGQRLLFVAYDQNQNATLLLTNLFGDVPRTVASPLASGFPGAFADANTVLYARDRADNPQPSGDWLIDIFRTGLTEGAEPELIGSFASLTGCGGGSPLPGDWQYWQELGLGGSSLLLVQTPFGIVHSVSCGGAGTGLLDTTTGEDRLIGTRVSRAAVSPDGKQLAGIEIDFDRTANNEKRTLIVADLSTLTVNSFETSAIPDQITWSADGSAVLYSSREQSGQIALTSSEQQSFGQLIGITTGIDRWTATLHRLELLSKQESTVAQLDAYAIARLSASPDGKSVFVSAVANMDAWVKGIAAHTIDPADTAQQSAAVPIALYRVDLSGGQPVQLADTLHSFTLNRASMPAS